MFKKTIGAAVVAASAVLGANAATAATVTVDRQSANALKNEAGEKFGFASDIMIGAETLRVGVGALQLTADDGSVVKKFMAFCLQPLERLSLPRVHEVGVDPTQDYADKIGALNVLASNFMDEVVDSVTGMAFQLAVWEIIEEEAGATLDVTDGFFKNTLALGSRSDAMDLANTWLAAIDGGVATESFMVLNADNTQDLLTDMPDPTGGPVVPLPASAILMLTALGGAAMVARRKA